MISTKQLKAGLCLIVLVLIVFVIWKVQTPSAVAQNNDLSLRPKSGQKENPLLHTPPDSKSGREPHEVVRPKPGGDEVKLGSWTNYPIGVPSDIMKIRVAGGALDNSHQLTPAIARLLNLTESEEMDVNRSLAEVFKSASAATASRLVAVPGKEGTYRIPADQQGAEALVEKLSRSLKSTLGTERGRDLLDSLDLIHYNAAFGALDAEVIFESTKVGGADNPAILPQGRYSLTSPTTGQRVAAGGLLMDDVSCMFGKETFKLDGQ